MNIKFFLVPVYAHFEFYGQIFIKTSLRTAEDGEGIGHLFDDETEVEPLTEHDATDINQTREPHRENAGRESA